MNVLSYACQSISLRFIEVSRNNNVLIVLLSENVAPKLRCYNAGIRPTMSFHVVCKHLHEHEILILSLTNRDCRICTVLLYALLKILSLFDPNFNQEFFWNLCGKYNCLLLDLSGKTLQSKIVLLFSKLIYISNLFDQMWYSTGVCHWPSFLNDILVFRKLLMDGASLLNCRCSTPVFRKGFLFYNNVTVPRNPRYYPPPLKFYLPPFCIADVRR